jgi:hypothetical protein
VVDHFAQLDIRNPALNFDGVPVLLVHVISRPDLLVTVAQVECQIGIAFQIRPRWNFIEWREREYFTGHLENENVFPERRALGDVRFVQAVFAEFREVHEVIHPRKIPGSSLIASRSCFP